MMTRFYSVLLLVLCACSVMQMQHAFTCKTGTSTRESLHFAKSSKFSQPNFALHGPNPINNGLVSTRLHAGSDSKGNEGIEPKYLAAMGLVVFGILYDFFITHHGVPTFSIH